jgi:hypothetical protein
MSLAYFKRFRMETELWQLPPAPALPEGYFWVPWDEGILELHAAVHHRAFSDSLDSEVFPSFGDHYGCLHLFSEMRRKPGFLAAATWMVACAAGCCGSIQGVVDDTGVGAIQNVGVVPDHRSLGLGSALILQSLHGFRAAQVTRVYLEVTAENAGAVRLYQRLGFRKMKTLYKAVDF